jgi:outer membrane protein TolC
MKGNLMLNFKKYFFKTLLFSLLFSFSFANTIVSSIESALAHSPKLKAKKVDLDIYEKEKEKAFANYQPTLDISVSKVLEKTEFKSRESTDTESMNYILSLKQNIYNGHYDSHSIEMAENDIAIQAMEYQRIKQEIIYEAIMAHLSIIVSTELLAMQKELLGQYTFLLKIASKKAFYGDSNEAIELESRHHQANLKYLGLEEGFELKKFQYKQLTGKEAKHLRADMKMRQALLIRPEKVDLSHANPSLLKKILEIEKSGHQIQRGKAKFLPKVALEIKAYKAEPLAQATYSTENQYSARLNVSYNLYNGNKDSLDDEINQLRKLKLMVEKEDLSEEIVSKYTDFYIKYTYSKKTFKRIKSYIKAEKHKYVKYKKIFQLSAEKTTIDLLLSLSNLYQAKELKIINEYNQKSFYNNLLLLQAKLRLKHFK